MINPEELLKPISDEKPCGEDIAYDPGFMELETKMQGKPETQFSPAEDPDWKAIRADSLELWKRSKNLRLATFLTCAELKLDGFAGFRQCMVLLNGLVEKYWATVHPVLDPADNDPTERVNIIASLAAPISTVGDPLKILERTRQAPLTNSAMMGRFSAADILRSKEGKPGPDNKPPPSEKQIRAAFEDTNKANPDATKNLGQAISEAITLVGQLDENLTKAVGAEKAADLEPLQKEIKEIQKHLAPYLPAGAVPGGDETGGGEGPGAGEGAGQRISGDIQSRGDVVKMLEKIRDYYKRYEPSSPVPFLLKRAERLVEKDFLEIMNDLAAEAVEQVTKITGQEPKPEEEGSSSSSGEGEQSTS